MLFIRYMSIYVQIHFRFKIFNEMRVHQIVGSAWLPERESNIVAKGLNCELVSEFNFSNFASTY